jgi:hypothetical protein
MTSCSDIKRIIQNIPEFPQKNILVSGLIGNDKDSCQDILNNKDHYNQLLQLVPIVLKPILTKYISDNIADNIINNYQPSLNEIANLFESCSQYFCNNGSDVNTCDSLDKIVIQILTDSGLIEQKNIILQILCSVNQPELQDILKNIFGIDFYNNLLKIQPLLDNCICKNISKENPIKEVCDLLNPSIQPENSKQGCLNLPGRTYTNKKYLNIIIVILCLSIILFILSYKIQNKLFKIIVIILFSLIICICLFILIFNPFNILYIDSEKTNKWISVPGKYRGTTNISIIDTSISMILTIDKNNKINIEDYNIIPNDSKVYKDINDILNPCKEDKTLSVDISEPENFGYKIVGSDKCFKKNMDGSGLKGLFVTQTGDINNPDITIILLISIKVFGSLITIQRKIPLTKII